MAGWDNQPEHEPALLEDRPGRGHPLAAWIVILAVTGFILWRSVQGPGAREKPAEAAGAHPIDFQLRAIVGLADMAPENRKQVYEQIKETLRRLPFRERLRTVPMAGELVDPNEAVSQADLLNQQAERENASKEDRRLLALLQRLYRAYAKGQFTGILNEEEQKELRTGLGWAGELALAPAGGDADARNVVLEQGKATVVGFLGILFGGCGLLLAGLVVLIILLIWIASNPHRCGVRPGSPHGGIYAETFAVWMVLFVGMQFGGAFVPGPSQFFVSLLGFALSALALAWPVFRGVPWRQVREDVGLTFGKRPGKEVASGLVAYLVSVPLMMLGFLIFFVIVANVPDAIPEGREPSHPVVEKIGKADAWLLFQIFFAVCVLAPLVEETFFRGVLYRHLREATNGFGHMLSFLASGLVASFLFAILHPQGPLLVPALMGLAMGFTLAREWRGSLVPCMIAHGISNGLVMLLAVNLLRK